MIFRMPFILVVLLMMACSIFSKGTGTLLLTNTKVVGGAGDLLLMDLATGHVDTLVKAVDTMVPAGPCFSPDGKKVAYRVTKKDNLWRGNRIRVIDLFTRVITPVGPDLPVYNLPLSWAGKYIYCVYGWSTNLQKVNVETGDMDTVFTFQALFDYAYWNDPKTTPGLWGQGNVSNDGTRGAYVITRAINNVFTFDLATNREINHSIGLKATCQAAMSPSGNLMIGTNHGVDVIQFYNDSVNTYQQISAYTFWFNRWSYNSENDLTFFNAADSVYYTYNLCTQRCDSLLKGLCVWNWDVRGWVMDTVAPMATSGLTATSTDHTIKLSWNAPASGATTYMIERNGVRIGTSSTTNFMDNNLSASTLYSYSVYANAGGVKYSAPSTGSFSTTSDQTMPRIIGAYAFGTTVDITFSEPVDSASATNIANYTFSPALSVSKAVFTPPRRVRLTTATTNGLAACVVTVTGVKDVSLNAMMSVSDSLSIVSNLVNSTGRTCKWVAIDSGVPYWTDDDKPPASMPSKSKEYGDLPFLQTSVGDGSLSATAEYLKFTINRRMVVMIIGKVIPSWCTADNGWTKTGNKIGDWFVLTKIFEPGEVTLKGTGAKAWRTYVVGFQYADSSVITHSEIQRLNPAFLPQLQLSPSPSNGGRLNISYRLSDAGRVRLLMYDTQGKIIRALVNEKQTIGSHRITFAGVDDRQQQLSNGVYFCKLLLENQVLKTERFVVLR